MTHHTRSFLPFWISLKVMLLVISVPILQLVSLRLYLKYGLELRLGFGGFTDYDFFIPGPLAVWIYIHCLLKETKHQIQFQPSWFIVNLVSVLSFLAVCRYWYFLSGYSLFTTWFIWTGLLFAIVISGALFFTRTSFFTQNKNFSYLIPASLIFFAYPLRLGLLTQIWAAYATCTAQLSNALLSLIGQTANLKIFYDGQGLLTIKHPLIGLKIGHGCSGLEGFYFYTLCFIITFSLRGQLRLSRTLFLAYFGGAISIFILNQARIFILVLLAISFRKIFGYVNGTHLFEWLAHLNLGWILYSVFNYYYLKGDIYPEAWRFAKTERSNRTKRHFRTSWGHSNA